MPDQFTEEGGIMQVVTRSRTYALIVGLVLSCSSFVRLPQIRRKPTHA